MHYWCVYLQLVHSEILCYSCVCYPRVYIIPCCTFLCHHISPLILHCVFSFPISRVLHSESLRPSEGRFLSCHFFFTCGESQPEVFQAHKWNKFKNKLKKKKSLKFSLQSSSVRIALGISVMPSSCPAVLSLCLTSTCEMPSGVGQGLGPPVMKV